MSNLLYNIVTSSPRPLVSVTPDTTVAQCIAIMVEKDIGAVVVMQNDILFGIVSERDIVRSCLHKTLDLNELKAIDIVYENISILGEHDTVERAMLVMTQTKRRHLLINEHGKPKAIVSIGDLLYYLLDDKARVIHHLRDYIAGDHITG